MKKVIFRQLAAINAALAITYLIGWPVVQYAYIERGYTAIGGEWLLILLVYWIGYGAAEKLFSAVAKKNDSDGQ